MLSETKKPMKKSGRHILKLASFLIKRTLSNVKRMQGERLMEEVAIIGGLIGVQFMAAGNAVLMSFVMSLGLKSLTIVTFMSPATSLLLSPLAFYSERSLWPKKFSSKLILRLILLSLGGTTFQVLMLKGMNLTSPAMGTAMPNVAPGLIFIIAWIFRLEKVNIKSTYSRVKIMGTMLCVVGAFAMSIMQSMSTNAAKQDATLVHYISDPTAHDAVFDKQKILGCIYLLLAISLLSSSLVLQAFIFRDFPAPISMCVITSFLGTFITAAFQFIEDHEIKTGLDVFSARNLIMYFLLEGAVNGVCISFSSWAIKKKGPVLVSMFSPIGTVCSAIFSVVTIGVTISVGSYGGMFIMFTGLYLFLWAKGKEEDIEGSGGKQGEHDIEKPLLE
ncbi:WAT1-related protein At5g47470-like isoform X1 [Arachis stenosperma]|uniref:WAT1-related protein At5g47470-like isoform X1 n=2 Tax=Arachis stenosperma TaxID=217475 RepID=UPI0025ACEBBD|nr:WAT1-related protein At5g47470-like isoform X1 [Arachis stenosperma]